MIKLDGIVAFLTTVEESSISAAARRLGLAKSVVSERLAELERLLGTSLLQRSTRRLTLTAPGEAFLARARRIVREIEEARAELDASRGKLAGPLRISAPVGFGTLHLGPAIARFLKDHPAIDMALELDDRFVDAATGGFDAVLRHGTIGESGLIARKLARSRRLLVAAPAYLAAQGRPASLAELEAHRGILYANRAADWRFAIGAGEAGDEGWAVVRPNSTLRVNNGIVMRDAALAGLGLALLPSFFVHEEVRSGALEVLDIGCQAQGADLFLTYPRNHSASAKIAALGDSLRQSFGDPPYWDNFQADDAGGMDRLH